MKRILFSLLLILAAAVSSSAQISAFFDKYSDSDNVTSVCISKAMLKMMPNKIDDNIRIGGLGEKLNCIRVLSTENKAMIAQLRADVKAAVAKENMEILVSAKDGAESATIYSKTNSKGITDYLIVSYEPTEISIVLISGTITPAEASRITGNAPNIR